MIIRLPAQPTRHIAVRRVADAWIVWLAGRPDLPRQTYALLYDTGRVELVHETDDQYHVTCIAGTQAEE
jgi:hypothetical protein